MRRTICLLALVALAGCGTTVRNAVATAAHSSAAGATNFGSNPSAVAGPSLPAGASTPTAPAQVASGPSGGASPVVQGSGGGSTPTFSTSGPGAALAATIPATGPGWDRNTVYIGITTQKDVETVANSVGAKGLQAGDQDGQANAMAAYLNGLGGIFGRKIQILSDDESTVSLEDDPNAVGQSTCTYFTQDHRVIALLNPVTLLDVPSFRQCMSLAHVPIFSASVAATDDAVDQALAPYFYQSVAPTWTALLPTLLSSLQAQGWFQGWNAHTGTVAAGTKPKIGILVGDDTISARIGGEMSSALAGAGYPGAQIYEFASSNAMSSAVLKFAGVGVDHVLSDDTNLVAFQENAATQAYKPRYAVTSFNAPVTFLEQNSPKGQNVGALGVGWAPPLDVDDAHDPGTYSTGETLCLSIMSKAGQTFAGERLARAVAFAFCDGMRLIAQSAVAGGGLTGPQLYAGVEKIGPTFSSALSFGSGLGPGRLFVPGAVRPLAYDAACNCFQYTSASSISLP